jgi:DNA-binding NarL/FixJ family response regulator
VTEVTSKRRSAATREITRLLPTTQVLVLTTLDDDETVFEAVRAGAHAYNAIREFDSCRSTAAALEFVPE